MWIGASGQRQKTCIYGLGRSLDSMRLNVNKVVKEVFSIKSLPRSFVCGGYDDTLAYSSDFACSRDIHKLSCNIEGLRKQPKHVPWMLAYSIMRL